MDWPINKTFHQQKSPVKKAVKNTFSSVEPMGEIGKRKHKCPQKSDLIETDILFDKYILTQ